MLPKTYLSVHDDPLARSGRTAASSDVSGLPAANGIHMCGKSWPARSAAAARGPRVEDELAIKPQLYAQIDNRLADQRLSVISVMVRALRPALPAPRLCFNPLKPLLPRDTRDHKRIPDMLQYGGSSCVMQPFSGGVCRSAHRFRCIIGTFPIRPWYISTSISMSCETGWRWVHFHFTPVNHTNGAIVVAAPAQRMDLCSSACKLPCRLSLER